MSSRRGGKKIVESDSEDEGETNAAEKTRDGEDSDSMDEEDVDEELGLPKELINSVSLKEKRELLQYKRSHNELDWENEMMNRIEHLSKKKDMERLKQMTGAAGGEEGSERERKKRGAKKSAPAAAKKSAKSRGRKRYEEEDDELEDEDDFVQEDEEDEDEEEAESEMDVEEDDEDSDDLFDEEELVTISKQTKADLKKDKVKVGKKLQGKKKTGTRKRSRLEDYDSSSDDGEDRLEEGEVDWGEARSEEDGGGPAQRGGKKRRQQRQQDEEEDSSEPAVLEDVLKIQSRRVLLEQWHAEPYFADVVRGSFVRYCVGYMPGGAATYRMAEVLDVVHMKPYKLPDVGVLTERGLLIAVGSKQTEAKMYKVSNSRITQREFDEWMGVLERAGEQNFMLRKKSVERRRGKIRAASQHTYTHEEVAAMIEKNSMKATKHTSSFSHALGMMRKELERARAEGDLEKMEQVQKEMDRLEREMAASKAKYSERYTKNTDINKRNKERNIQMDMEAGVRKREMDMKKTKEEKRRDPFARRDSRPTILWVTGKKPAEKGPGGDVLQPVQEEADQPQQQQQTEVAEDQPEDVLAEGHDTLEQIGKRIQKKLGFNPHQAVTVDKRTKYLEEACGGLPDLGSEMRGEVRQGISLAQYLQRVSEQMVE